MRVTRAVGDEPAQEQRSRDRTGKAEPRRIVQIGTPDVPLEALLDWQLSNIYEIYPVWRYRYGPGVTHNTEHVFSLCVPAGIPVQLAPREHLRHGWWPWREAADRCFSPSNAEAILQLPQRLRAAASVVGPR
mgnify:CR=1 FL=1